ncbi:MAG TPA: bacteriohemerythrin [Nitrospirota bacterium]|nr:bacteriohemerythrin [Nitrospirota bacterium]
MAYVQWSSKYSVQVPEIDEQHKKLVDLINEMYDAMGEGKGGEMLGRVITELAAYTLHHFETEERLLLERRYPELDEHRQMHNWLASKARDLEDTYASGHIPTTIEVMLLLTNWLNAHIFEEDRKYVPYVVANVDA